MDALRLIRFPLALGLSVSLLAVVGLPVVHAEDRDCADFPNQAAAQRYFIDQGGPTADPDNLDDIGPGDGVACEALPCPCSTERRRTGKAKPKAQAKRISATIVGHVDGDTVKVRYRDGARPRRTVRLIGIDTPETRRPNTPVQCGGPEASDSLKDRLPLDARVLLRTDPTQATRDRYGRLLAYVQRGGRDIGRSQIARGWATTFVYGAKAFQRVDRYRRAEREAVEAGRGVYGLCGGEFHSPVAGVSAACDSIRFAGRSYVFYKSGLRCRNAKAKARKVRHQKHLRGWTCESGSNFTSGGGCHRGRKIFGWHPYD